MHEYVFFIRVMHDYVQLLWCVSYLLIYFVAFIGCLVLTLLKKKIGAAVDLGNCLTDEVDISNKTRDKAYRREQNTSAYMTFKNHSGLKVG